MRLTCPSCGAAHSAEGWTNDAQARQCLLLVAELPSEVSRRALRRQEVQHNKMERMGKREVK
ncbi:MAG: hypothetical protein M0036_17170 [Desulfobacteraceae bacterium]|nr:hypothetical protein [Desulfobacteraceae bacterium]